MKGLKEEEEEPQKYIPNKERDEYEIGQNTTMMKTTHKKIKECTNKRYNSKTYENAYRQR